MKALDGIKVLDLTRVLAGPYCTMMLGDLGAEIIKIEHPSGDDTRKWGPPFTKKGQQSAYFLAVNRNKKSITINFKSKKGRAIIQKLALGSDVLIENYLPGKLDAFGLGYNDLSKINPRLIYASITGYGQTGPYSNRPGYDVVTEAESGLMHITGESEGNPLKIGVAITDLTAGLYTKGAILAALYAREKCGKGQKIDVSLMECQLASLANVGSSYLISGNEAKRWGNQHSSIVPYQSFKTKDGHIVIGAGNDSQYEKFCIAIDRADLITPQYKTNSDRVKHRIQLISEISKTIIEKTVNEWTLVLDSLGIPFGPVNNLQQSFDHPQAKFRKMITEIAHPTAGVIKLVSPPIKYSLTKPVIATPPPLLGQHTSKVLENMGYSMGDIEQMHIEGVLGDSK